MLGRRSGSLPIGCVCDLNSLKKLQEGLHGFPADKLHKDTGPVLRGVSNTYLHVSCLEDWAGVLVCVCFVFIPLWGGRYGRCPIRNKSCRNLMWLDVNAFMSCGCADDMHVRFTYICSNIHTYIMYTWYIIGRFSWIDVCTQHLVRKREQTDPSLFLYEISRGFCRLCFGILAGWQIPGLGWCQSIHPKRKLKW